MTVLEASGVVVSRGTREVARADRLAIEEGETLAILGPNGAGKTSLLLALAALLPRQGELRLRGEPLRDELAYRRRIGVVFQRPLLLDRSVRDNAALGAELRGATRAESRRRAMETLTRLGVAHLADRPAAAISGGEAQRVSIARALAVSPELLFLDEPFAALDAPTRESLIADLARLLREERITTVLVTHDRDEALALADRVAVLIGGRLRQLDRTEKVFAEPIDAEVAAFVGVENVLAARVETATDEITLMRVGGATIAATAAPPTEPNVLLLIAPDDVVLSRGRETTSERNVFDARVQAVEPIGRRVRVTLDCGFQLVAHVTRQSARELALAPEQRIVASFKATVPHLLPAHRDLDSP